MASSRGLLLQGGAIVINNHLFKSCSRFSKVVSLPKLKNLIRNCSTTTTSTGSSFHPPDVPALAKTARISLTPAEVEEVTSKILQVIDWFGQLQDVEFQSVEPAVRADMEGDEFREDITETFENRDALISSVPSYADPYIKVPKVLNKE